MCPPQLLSVSHLQLLQASNQEQGLQGALWGQSSWGGGSHVTEMLWGQAACTEKPLDSSPLAEMLHGPQKPDTFSVEPCSSFKTHE